MATPAPSLYAVDSSLPDPPYPADTRVKGWRFELDYERIEASDTWALASADLRPWLFMLWVQAWKQAPAASMPDNDRLIAARIGMSLTMFQAHRETLMRGWTRCRDGLLYHPVIVEKVRSMLLMREGESKRKADYRAKQKQEIVAGVPQVSQGTHVGRPWDTYATPRPSPGKALPEPEPEPITKDQPLSSPADAGNPCPDCPQQEIVALWHEVLPQFPAIATWGEARRATLRARWRDRWAAGKYATKDDGLTYWRRVFVSVGKSKFLSGQTSRDGWTCKLPWLIKAGNFAKFLDGDYNRDEK